MRDKAAIKEKSVTDRFVEDIVSSDDWPLMIWGLASALKPHAEILYHELKGHPMFAARGELQLRPHVLLRHVAGIVFKQMDIDEDGIVNKQDAISWSRNGRDLYKEILDAVFTAEVDGEEDEF